MSSLAYSPHDRIRRHHTEDYRHLLDNQPTPSYKQPYNPRIRNLHTQPDLLSQFNSPKGSRFEPRQRKLVQQSTFLPSINKRDSIVKMHDRRPSIPDLYGSTYGYEGTTSNTVDTEYQAITHINECQTIIENLKRLAHINKNRADKIKAKYPSSQQFQPRQSQADRQPSFFQSREETDDGWEAELRRKKSSPLKKYNKIFEPSGKNTSRKYEDFGEFDSRVKSNKSQFEQQYSRIKYKPKQKLKEKQKEKEKQKVTRQKDKSISSIINVEDINQFADNDEDQLGQFDIEEQREQEESSRLAEPNQGNEDQQRETEEKKEREKEKEEEQLRKAQLRQKFLLKFLGKARTRGAELQRKISKYRVKHDLIPKPEQKTNPQKQQQEAEEKEEPQQLENSPNSQEEKQEVNQEEKHEEEEEKEQKQEEKKKEQQQDNKEESIIKQPDQSPPQPNPNPQVDTEDLILAILDTNAK